MLGTVRLNTAVSFANDCAIVNDAGALVENGFLKEEIYLHI